MVWSRHLFFFIPKKKKKTNYKIHDWTVSFIDWIKEITYLGKLESYIVLGQSTKNTWLVVLVTFYPKINKNKTRSTKPKNPKSGG